MKDGAHMEGRAASAAPFKRALFAGLAIIGALAILPSGSSYALFSDTEQLQPAAIQTGSLSVQAVKDSTSAAIGTGDSPSECCAQGAGCPHFTHVNEVVLGDGEWACVSNTVEVRGTGQNLNARLDVTLDSTGIEHISLRNASVTRLDSADVESGELVAAAAPSGMAPVLTAQVPGFSADGSTYFRITYLIEHDGTECPSGTCSTTQPLPAVTVDAVQEAR